ncbi:MAG TPA: exonuclease domain-containing protein [Streptosporangiaceae bacterium]
MIEALAGLSLVVVDVETTGWLADGAELTEIGAVRLRGAQLTGEFCSLVRPGAPIPEAITVLTGITDDMVSRAPLTAPALRAFLAFARGCVLVAHNAPFDVGFLTTACAASGVAWPPRAVLDTAVLARLVLGRQDVPDYRLSTLARYFGTRTEPCHRALADAKATGEILTGLLDLLAAKRTTRRRTAPRCPGPSCTAPNCTAPNCTAPRWTDPRCTAPASLSRLAS